ncbi:MAG: hypothetical protein JWN07_946 [Hyphomicrobiales bacterium]|nr:hypothetical protein [Hyphomicrobiales bacterium]
MDISDFAGIGPELLPEHFLAGNLEGWGVLESALGSLKSRFTVKANGVPVSDGVDFTETWTFDDGLTDTLHWKIRRKGLGEYTGTEPKVDGEARGEQAGFAFHWTYTRETPQQGGSTTTLNFDDWFYLIDERTCIVRGAAGRLGLPFAIMHVTYQRVS